MEPFAIFVIGIVIGGIVASIFYLIKMKKSDCGTLRIESSDPDGPYMFLELDKDVGDISGKKRVVLNVSTKNYVSH